MADSLTLDRHAMKNRATAHLRIYVGGLTEQATIDDLYEHFIQYGPIDGIVINKLFGFVQFRNEFSAQQAISNSNGSTFQGKNINVKTARTTDDRREPPPASNNEEIVNQPDKPSAINLNDNAPSANDNEDLYDNFGNFVGDQAYRDEEELQNKSESRDDRGRGRGKVVRGARGRGNRGRRGTSFREQSPLGGRGGKWNERRNYDHYSQQMAEYPRALPVPERNDCEIIVVSKTLTEYAEYIEGRLKRLGIVVDLLFPMADVPIGKVLGNIASRGCLYAILVMPQNQENRSLTLTILHGLPQEHRNMPIEDALQMLSRNFQEVRRGCSSGREAVYALLGQLADGNTLTVLQYDKVIDYLQERKEQQIKVELGETLATPVAPSKTHVDLQQRILSILNEKKILPQNESAAAPTPPAQGTQNKLLNDPTVKKALDSILQKFT